MAIKREDVLCADRIILEREPESEAALLVHMYHDDLASLRESFLSCPELKRKSLKGYLKFSAVF